MLPHIVWVSLVFFFFYIRSMVGVWLIIKYYTASIQSSRVFYIRFCGYLFMWYTSDTAPCHISIPDVRFIRSSNGKTHRTKKNVYSWFTCFIVRRSPSTNHSPFADVPWLLAFRYRYIIFPGNQYTHDMWYHIWNNFSFGSSVINFPERLRKRTNER